MLDFLRDRGVRETIESLVVAIILALMFRGYEAEAFIIPTGSMAPTLRGEHMDLQCDKCGYQFVTGASGNNGTYENPRFVTHAYCPLCQYRMKMHPKANPDHNSFDGDRILVNKFIYDFIDPKRWDVIVFKNPNNAKQNFIKRCVGLPNENMLIENGDIFTYDPRTQNFDERQIARKPPRKLKAMLQLVDDNNFVAKDLKDVDWPSRWAQWSGPKDGKSWQANRSGWVCRRPWLERQGLVVALPPPGPPSRGMGEPH